MKEFDLEKALAGEPVLLRDGKKGIVFYRVPDKYKLSDGEEVDYKLRGMTFDTYGFLSDTCASWTLGGAYNLDNNHNDEDIIGMWEEPKISIEDLPKPFQPDIGDEFYYISTVEVSYCSFYTDLFADMKRNGQCFRTKEDVQKWIHFMKGMME